MLNRLTRTFARRSSANVSSEPLALYWDGANTFIPLTMKHSNWVEQEGPYSGFGNWMRPDSAYRDLLAGDNGFTQAYLTCEWVFRAVNVLSLKVAEIMRRGQVFAADGSVCEQHAYLSALEETYRQYDQRVYKEWVFSKVLYGEAYIELVPSVYRGTSIVAGVKALRILNALYTEPVITNGRVSSYDYSDNEGRSAHIPTQQVVMDKRYNPLGELRGLSLLTAALDAVNIDRSQVAVTRNFLRNNARPGLVFTLKDNKPISPDAINQIQTIIKERAKGARNAGNNLMLPAAMDVTTVPAPNYTEGAALTDEQKRRICSATGIPSALVDFTDQAYQLSPQQMQNFYELTLIPEAQEIAEAVDVRIMPSFDKTAKFKLPIEDIRGELGDPQVKTSTASQKYRDGVISINEYRRATGEQPLPDDHDFFLLPTGSIVIPASQIGDAATIVAAARPQFPNVTGTLVNPQVQPELPDASGQQQKPPPQLVSGKTKALVTESAFVYLDLANDAQISAIQNQLRAEFGNNPAINWQDPATFHVTLVYCDAADDDRLLGISQSAQGQRIVVESRELGLFDNADERALHLVVTITPELRALQSSIYAAFVKRDLPLSPFSDPPAYKAHITLAYLPPGVDAPNIAINVNTQSDRVVFGRDEYQTFATVKLKAVDMVTLPSSSVRHQDTPLAELKAWRKVELQRGARKAIRFMAHSISAVHAEWIQDELDAIEQADDHDAIKALFEDAAYLLGDKAALKDYADTEQTFIDEITGIIGNGQDGTFSAQKLGGQMRSIIRRAGLIALRDGFNAVGQDPESFDAKTLAAFRDWQTQQSGFVSNFVQEVTKQGITPDEVELRAKMWANRTLESARELGISLGAPDAMLMWVEDGTHDKCADCLRLDGQVHSMKSWLESGYTPTSGKTECKSYNCLCQLKPTDQPESGEF